MGLAERTRARVLQASTPEVYGDPEVPILLKDGTSRITPKNVGNTCKVLGNFNGSKSVFSETSPQETNLAS